jgi:hypothetical protein
VGAVQAAGPAGRSAPLVVDHYTPACIVLWKLSSSSAGDCVASLKAARGRASGPSEKLLCGLEDLAGRCAPPSRLTINDIRFGCFPALL